MLNLVTEKSDYPSAVLIRAIEPIEGTDIMKKNRNISNVGNLTSGPGKLTKAFGIDKNMNGVTLIDSNIYLLDMGFNSSKICTTSRIGVDYAEDPWKSIKWRFYDASSHYLSHT